MEKVLTNLNLKHISMATLRNYYSLGCGDDLRNRAGDRQLMTNLSRQKIVPDRKECRRHWRNRIKLQTWMLN